MDVFSLLDGKMRKLTKEKYIADTRKMRPYYAHDGKRYAICPLCKNPIVIVNLDGDTYREKMT